MKARHGFISAVMLFIVGISALSAPPAPSAADVAFNIGSGFNNTVRDMALAPDGSGDIYVGGDYTSYDGSARNRIVRLNANGSIDTAFDIGSGFNDSVNRFAPGPSGTGDLYVGGSFTSYKGTTANRLIRLNPDGSIDTGLTTGTGFNGKINALIAAPDGDLYVGGEFTTYRGTTVNHIVRLDPDGTRDAAFAAGGLFNFPVLALALALDGSGDLYVGGDFSTPNKCLVRVNSNGTVDTSFNTGAGFNQSVLALAPALDGSGDLYVCGAFGSYKVTTSAPGIIRLNSDATVDTAFNTDSGFNRAALDLALPSTDGSGDVYVGGEFTTFVGGTRNRIVRLNSNGTLDSSFNTGAGFNNTVRRIVMSTSEPGNLFVGGNFTLYNGVSRNRIVSLGSNGAIDSAIWNIGDVFVAEGNSQFRVYAGDGTHKETIVQTGQSAGQTAGCSFNPELNKLYTTNHSNTKVVVFDDAVPHSVLQTIDTNAQSSGGNSHSIVFAANGDFYVGHTGGDDDIHRYNAAGVFQQKYNVVVDVTGSNWMDLSIDQQTLFYTSQSRTIHRYNVAGSGTQLTGFATLQGDGGTLNGIRLLPPWDGSGGLIVADGLNIKRLDGSGSVVQAYDVAGEDAWYTMNLDPNGTSFWAACSATARFYRFNIITGDVEVGPVTRTGSGTLLGLCVKGEITAALIDNQPPQARAGSDRIVECASHSGTPVTLDGTASSDPEGETLTYEWTNSAGQVVGTAATVQVSLALGTHAFTLEVTDVGGLWHTDIVVITVADTTPPALSNVPAPVTVEQTNLNGTAAALANPTVTDLCDPTPALTNNAPSVFPLGVTTVTFTAVDDEGNQSFATTTVTVRDTTPPAMANVPAPITVEQTNRNGTPVSVPLPTATDICDAAPIVTSHAPAILPLAETSVLFTATDASGRQSTASTTVTVRDTTPPMMTGGSGSMTVEQTGLNGASVALTPPSASDICDAAPVVTSNAPTIFPLGNTAVTFTATDASGNQSTSSPITITVRDTTSPTISNVPSPITVEQTNRNGTPVILPLPTVIDICDAAPVVTNDAPLVFPLGATQVTFRATDASGNQSSATFVVTVRDTTPPAMTNVPANITVEQSNLNGTPVSVGVPTATDICDASPNVTSTAPTVFPLGATPVTFQATDASGNQSSATVTVTVRDTTPPIITRPADIQLGCSVDPLVTASFQFSASDICDASPTVVANPASGSGFPVGTTVVTITATDHSGNVSTATFNVVRAPLQFTGFLSPIGGADASGGSYAAPIKTFKYGSTVPIKFTLACDGQAVVTGVHTLSAAKFSSETSSDAAIDATPQDQATSGNEFKLSGGQWHFNLATDGMSAGVWLLTATLSDGSKHGAWIQLK